MSYGIRFSREAEKDFARLDRTLRERVRQRVRALAENPYDPRIGKMLTGGTRIRSSRVGGWRILYVVNQSAGEVEIITIRPRGEVYRRL